MGLKPIVLASTSPRRRELFRRLGVPFEIMAPQFEETPIGRPVEEECLYFAEEKARSVASTRPNAIILAFDTLIDLGGEKLGKPKDEKDAEQILRKLSGKTHRVLTAAVLLDAATGKIQRHVEASQVRFRPMTDEEIRAYVATGEPMGKAGAYAVQGRARGLFIEEVTGDEDSVIGLPLALVKRWLEEFIQR